MFFLPPQVFSKETRVKKSISVSGEKNPFATKLIDTKTNIIYGTMKIASEKLGIKYSTLSAMLNGHCKNNTNLDQDDIRYKLINKYNNLDFPIDITKYEYDEFNSNMKKILNIIDFSESEEHYCGLPLYTKQLYLNEDKYENIYSYFNETIINEISKQNPIIYDNI